jgi:hypothetical protein
LREVIGGTQIKNKIRLDESLNEEQQKQLWDLLEEVFAWHKGELGQCYVGEHLIDTQGLPPYRMTLGWLSYWEEIEGIGKYKHWWIWGRCVKVHQSMFAG